MMSTVVRGGAYSFVAFLSRMAITHASLVRRRRNALSPTSCSWWSFEMKLGYNKSYMAFKTDRLALFPSEFDSHFKDQTIAD